MKAKATAGMRCEMARLRCKADDLGPGSMVDVRRIDRAIAAAVRKERARCAGVCIDHLASLMDTGPRGAGCWAIEDVLKAITKGDAKRMKGGG